MRRVFVPPSPSSSFPHIFDWRDPLAWGKGGGEGRGKGFGQANCSGEEEEEGGIRQCSQINHTEIVALQYESGFQKCCFVLWQIPPHPP